MLKIGENLAKLWQKIKWHLFPGHVQTQNKYTQAKDSTDLTYDVDIGVNDNFLKSCLNLARNNFKNVSNPETYEMLSQQRERMRSDTATGHGSIFFNPT